MSAAEWIAKRRELLAEFLKPYRGKRHDNVGLSILAQSDLPRALDALEAALAAGKGHRDFVTKHGRDDCICTICDICRAIETALRGES